MDSAATPDFLPTASLLHLQRRAELIQLMRTFFRERGSWEVETPVLSAEVVLDAWLEPFVTSYHAEPRRWAAPGRLLYLQTSPEAHMKRLLAAGAEAIFQFSRVFRNGEQGTRHNPEFTMLEWYRAGDDLPRQMDFTEELVRTVWKASRPWHADAWDASQPFERLTYDAAFLRFTGQRVLESPTSELVDLAARHQLVPPAGLEAEDRDGWLNFLLAELIEPNLGTKRPTFLQHYPASQTALARVVEPHPGGPLVAERFELYVHGVELCNGYHELTDAAALRQRTEQQLALRAESGLRTLSPPRRLLAAMEAGLPACSGVALGVDRLVMLALGAKSLAEVIAFPHDRA